jgi:PAS domain-containing protein/DNA-binding CsgD family transcriptional regulator
MFNQALVPFENIDPAIIGLTSIGEIIYVNRSACDLLHHTKEELEGLPIGALIPGMTASCWSRFWLELDHADSGQAQLTLHLNGNKKLEVEFRPLFVHESCQKYCIMIKPGKRPAAGVNGGIHNWPLALVLSRMGNPAVIRDEQHKIVFLNQAACQWLGTTACEAAGTTVFDYLPKRYADLAWKQEQIALDSGRASTHACHGFLRAKYHESVTLLPFLDPGTAQKRLLVIANNPAHATRALPMVAPGSHNAVPGRAESHCPAKVHEILESEAPFGIYFKNTDNRILWVNHAFARITGLETKDFLDQRVEDLVSDNEILGTLREQDNYVYATGKPLFNFMIPRFNNQSGYYRLDKLPFINRSGELAGIIGLVVEVEDTHPPIEALKKELVSTSKKLAETETALRVLIERREQDVSLSRDALNAKVKDLLVPYLENLKQTQLTAAQSEFVDLIETNLKNFYDPAYARLSSPAYRLSPTELKVAQLVRDGKTNKEIAQLLHLSRSTILTHRHHVRVKLGIRNKKVNLRSLLNS